MRILIVLTLCAAVLAAAGAVWADTNALSVEGATGTTVVIHGFQLSGDVPDWPFYLAEAIRARAGGGRIFEYDPAIGDLLDCSHPACGPQGAGGETVIVYDWAVASNQSGTGFSEAAGEALVAGLVEWSGADPPLASLDRVHLIGHSRGTVVASEAAERLVAAGLPAPEHMTSLDPHDTGAFGLSEERPEPEGLWDDLDVNDLHPEYKCGPQPGEPSGVCSWQGVGYHDNYWRDQDGFPCLFDPDGKPVPGSSEFDASGLDAYCHSDVHAWYYFTVDTTATTHPETGDPPGLDWFDPGIITCDSAFRTSPLARTVDGYNTSRIGGSPVRCPDDPSSKQEVRFDFNLPEGLLNGDFEKQPAADVVAGWWLHGGGGNAVLANDGDPYIRLEVGQSRRHGRFYVPNHTSAIRFCRRIEVAGPGDELTLTLHQGAESRILHQEDPTGTSGWQCLNVALQDHEDGTTSTLELALHDNGAAPEARIGIDDITLVVGLFSDGFESGDLSAWSDNLP